MKILVVECAPLIRHTIISALSSERGHEIVEIGRSRDVLEKIGTLAPDAIIIGSEVAGMEGVELAMHIRTLPAHRATPLVLISGKRSYDHVLQAVQCGVDDYLVTPFTGDVLLQKLDHAVRRRESARMGTPLRKPAGELFLNS